MKLLLQSGAGFQPASDGQDACPTLFAAKEHRERKTFLPVLRSLCSFAAMILVVVFPFTVPADDAITNFMSPIVSYQYQEDVSSEALTNGGIQSPIISYQFQEDFGSAALTNGGIMSPIVSYQYLEWPGDDVLSLQSSPVVSYYYQFLDAPALNIVSTTRMPTTAESTPAYLISPPPPSQLMAYDANAEVFTANLASIDPNQMTIVLTHGWIPTYPLTLNLVPIYTPNGIDDWPITMAAELHAQNSTANIVAWNWRDAATSPLDHPQQAGSQSPQQGASLGAALLNALGPNYSKKIHFIGHSFGTLVNAYAANFLQGNKWANNEPVSPTPWPANNMLMTLFDEAEIGADIHFIPSGDDLKALIAALKGQNGSLPSYYHPLPKDFAWAENYISEFGLPYPNAANVVLTVGSPANAPDPKTWFLDMGSYHGYPMVWYEPTIQTVNSAMGFVWPYLWSLDDPTFANAPTVGSLYLQADNGNPYNLTQPGWNEETDSLIARLESYAGGLGSSFVQFANNTLTANGTISPQAGLDLNAADSVEWIFNMKTTSANSGAPLFKASPLIQTLGDASSNTNTPAYVWMQLVIPTNAISMSFNYLIQGDWQSDSLAAAFNGTNVLSLPGSEIETNVLFNSGSIDVSSYAGQTNEFFIGIVGGTSTNAQLTVENLAFSIALPPLLQAQVNGGNLTLSWPMSAQNFSLQTTTNLADPNSWMTLTNVPAIVNLQNAVTNPVSGGMRFYRLKQ